MTESTSAPESAAPAGDAGTARNTLPGLSEKPTIAEVAAWLRRAAEERRKEAEATTATDEQATGLQAEPTGDEAPPPSTDAGEAPSPQDPDPGAAAAEDHGHAPEAVAVTETAPVLPLFDDPTPTADDTDETSRDEPVRDESQDAPAAIADALAAVDLDVAVVPDTSVTDVAPPEQTTGATEELSSHEADAASEPTASRSRFSFWAPTVDDEPAAIDTEAATVEPVQEPEPTPATWPLVVEPAEPVGAVSRWAPDHESPQPSEPDPPEPPRPGPDLLAIATGLDTAPTPVVEVDDDASPDLEPADAVDAVDDRPLAVPKIGLFTLPDEVPAAPMVLGVPAITLPPDEETDEREVADEDEDDDAAATEAGVAVGTDADGESSGGTDTEAPGEDEDEDGDAVAADAGKTVPKRKRAKRPKVRYPRGQLKERIGFFRRVRALIGITIVAVLLGIVLAALIGGALIFIFLAGRSAINS